MSRRGGAWIADGRAKAIRADCEASLAALDGLAIDLYLIHAPDPRTPWRTSVRALARLVDEGLVRRVGLSNVNRGQLDEALELAPVAAVQVALSPSDDHALRGGVVERCAELGIAVIAHSPLGGPRRAGRLDKQQALADVASARGATPAEVALAWLLGLSPVVVPIPGARRPETARSAAAASKLTLAAGDRKSLDRAFGLAARPSRPATSRRRRGHHHGHPGSREEPCRRGARLPGATSDSTATSAAAPCATSPTRSTRRWRQASGRSSSTTPTSRGPLGATSSRPRPDIGLAAKCIWLDTPLAQAQVNLVERLLERFGSLPSPDELREVARREPGVVAPTSQMRTLRELEPPALDEGFAEVEQVPFVRVARGGPAGVGVYVAAAAAGGRVRARRAPISGAPHLVFDWSPDSARDALDDATARVAAQASGPVESALCPHPAGPPICWCRPPLPGLPLAFARAHGVDPAHSMVIGTGPAHKTLATALGATYVQV